MNLEKYTEYCMEQDESYAKVSKEEFINWAEEV